MLFLYHKCKIKQIYDVSFLFSFLAQVASNKINAATNSSFFYLQKIKKNYRDKHFFNKKQIEKQKYISTQKLEDHKLEEESSEM